MHIKIWGAQGSYPQPITPEFFETRIKSIVQRIRPSDIASTEDRERFLSVLPDWLVGILGGNTACLELRLSDNSLIIFDAGTGIIPLSRYLISEDPDRSAYHIFFSHFHYDHVQGLPFFEPAYNPENELHFYSPEPRLKEYLQNHMIHPYFPVRMEDVMTKNQHFHILSSGSLGERTLPFSDATMRWKEITHPGRAYAYKVTEAGKSIIYATDFGISKIDLEATEENIAFFKNADVIILDSMYSLGESIEKHDWGHSSYIMGVNFAMNWGIKKLILFHHDPQCSDKHLFKNLHSARSHAHIQNENELKIEIAREGMLIEL
ncbi:MAG: MBL fold metallo-hydrolase [Salinispira sp.]